MTATQELVVPRSIPMTFAITDLSFWQTVRALSGTRHCSAKRERRSPRFGEPADSSGGVPRLYRWQAYDPQGEAGMTGHSGASRHAMRFQAAIRIGVRQ